MGSPGSMQRLWKVVCELLQLDTAQKQYLVVENTANWIWNQPHFRENLMHFWKKVEESIMILLIFRFLNITCYHENSSSPNFLYSFLNALPLVFQALFDAYLHFHWPLDRRVEKIFLVDNTIFPEETIKTIKRGKRTIIM